MPRKIEAYIHEILNSIEEIELYKKGLTLDTYKTDSKTKAAIERKLLNVGEALNQLSQTNPQHASKITDLRKIVAFRNILVHGYFGIDDALVWDIINTKLLQLKKEVGLLN